MANRTIEPYGDPQLPERFNRWLEILRAKIGAYPCYIQGTGSPEGAISAGIGDLYYDETNEFVYVKTTAGGTTGWVTVGSAAGVIATDIATGTPPTTELVTGFYLITDLTGDDDLASFGFGIEGAGGNLLQFRNHMRGGGVELGYEDPAGVERKALIQDPVGEVDPNFSSVVFLAPFDGPDTATTAPDISTGGVGSPHTMTFVGNAQLDSSQSVFGVSALLLDGIGDWVTVPDSADWHKAGGDFTIDARIRFATLPAGIVSRTIVSHYEPNAGGRSYSFDYNNNSGSPLLRFFYSTDGLVNTLMTAPFSAAIDTWYEVAVARIGTVLRLFVDRVQIGADFNIGADVLFNSPHVLTIGALGRAFGGPTSPWDGWIEDLRDTKGVGRYADDYIGINGQFPTDVGFNGLTIGSTQFRNRIDNALHFKELSVAPADVDGYGQIFVRDDDVVVFRKDTAEEIALSQNPTATTAELADITDLINTSSFKVAGFMVFNTTTGAPVWSVGAADGSLWVDATGATAHTPV